MLKLVSLLHLMKWTELSKINSTDIYTLIYWSTELTPLAKSLATACLITASGIVPALAQDGFVWHYHRSVDVNPFNTRLGVAYAIPESDGVLFTASCEIGAGGPYISAELGADIGARAEGAADQMRIISGNGVESFIDVLVVGTTREEGILGVEIALQLDDPFWQTLRNGGILSYELPGAQMLSMPLAGATGPMSDLLNDCANIGDLGEGAVPSLVTASCETIFSMRSQNGDVPQRVTFTNAGDGFRALYWMDYNGNPVQISEMNPGESVTIDSFLTHPWMVTDGPGNCLEAMELQAGQSTYTFTALNQFFGNE